jgi:hypothetical protein
MPGSPASQELVYCSVEEFALRSGLSVSTVRRYLKAGKLLHRQPGGPRGRILIPLSALETGGSESLPEATIQTEQKGQTAQNPKTTHSLERLPGPMPRWARHRGQA